MSQHHILDFLIAVEEVRSQSRLVQEVEVLLRRRGIGHFQLSGRMPGDVGKDLASLADSWPVLWKKRYAERRYGEIDPVLRTLRQSQHGFNWHQALEECKGNPAYRRMVDMMQDARQHGLAEGATMPVFGRFGLTAALSLAGGKCTFTPVELSLFSTVAARFFWRMIELSGTVRAGKQAKSAHLHLTPRSIELISLLAEGLTSQEMSRRLNVSCHTVDWHFSNIQRKLDARNRHQILALAIRSGLIA